MKTQLCWHALTRYLASAFLVASLWTCDLTAFGAVPSVPPSSSTVALAFGSNRAGKTGLGLDDGATLIATPLFYSNLASQPIIQVDASASGISGHSLVLLADGNVLTFGSNGSGKTGLGVNSGDTLVPTPIDMSLVSGRKVTQVAAAWQHSLLLADDGTVFSFGSDVNGQTGRGVVFDITVIATPIDATNLGDRKVTQIDGGGLHSILLTDDGTVFTFGWNNVGQTGLGTVGPDTPIATAIDTTNLNGKTIVQVAAGSDHNLLLAEDGTVYSFGSNLYGQNGLGLDSGATAIATAIDVSGLGGKKIKQVSAGGIHSLLLAEDGTVFSFGNNGLGSTGQGTTVGNTLVAAPIDATNLGGKNIVEVSAGSSHNLLLADDGTVFSFGRNSDGATGLGFVFQSTTIATPIVTTNLEGLKVVQISAGDSYSLILATTAIPEPQTLAMTFTAVAGAFLFLRRRQR